jgi:hypothetical protein
MKLSKRIIQFVFLAGLMFAACNQSDDVVTANAKEGAFLSVEGSSGQLAGAPESGVELEDAEIDFQAADLTYNATVVAGADDVAELVIRKTFKGQTVEVARSTEPNIIVEYDALEDYLAGFDGVTADELRVGDVITFQTYISMTDGRELVNAASVLNIAVSCMADLTGTYSVTNTSCPGDPDFPFTATITKNADGSYHLSSADGGFLHRCTGNTTLLNAGDIVEQCGTILASTNLDFGSAGSGGAYDIGDITGGTWNAETGVLTLVHTQTWSAARPGEWTSTYVRQ